MPKLKTNDQRLRTSVTIRELALPKEAGLLYPLVKQVNPSLTRADFNRYLKNMLPRGYRCVGAFSAQKLVGITGVWTATRFWCGKYMEVDNLVVDASQRSGGIGKLLMNWVEKEAKRQKCQIVMADSYTHNHASHRFYFREGYVIKGYCFVKDMP